mgnify:FL=1
MSKEKNYDSYRLNAEEMDELFEQAIYEACKALEDDDEFDIDNITEVSQETFVQLVESFDPDYKPAPNNLSPEQCRYGVDFDKLWRGVGNE